MSDEKRRPMPPKSPPSRPVQPERAAMSGETMEMRLCDDSGLVSNEQLAPVPPGAAHAIRETYLQRHNRLAAMHGHEPVAAFACTGSAHLIGEHIRCTSPVHTWPVVS